MYKCLVCGWEGEEPELFYGNINYKDNSKQDCCPNCWEKNTEKVLVFMSDDVGVICKNCDEGYIKTVESKEESDGTHTITRYTICECCSGFWYNCKTCVDGDE